MDNLEKVKKASELAEDINIIDKKIKVVNNAFENFKNNKNNNATIKVGDGYCLIEVILNKCIFDEILMRLKEEFEKKQKELDELLNGPVNKIKEYIENGGKQSGH